MTPGTGPGEAPHAPGGGSDGEAQRAAGGGPGVDPAHGPAHRESAADPPGSASEAAPARGRRARWWTVPLALAALLIALYVFRVPLLVGVARLVEVHQPPLRSDVVFLLSGDGRQAGRAEHAASLHLRGFAPVVLLARPEDPPAALLGLYPNDGDVNIGILRNAGVQDSAIRMITVPGGVTSTTDEGRVLAWYLRSHPAERVLVVTSEYHTRRARWAIRHGLGDIDVEIRMAGARDPRFYAGNWWRSEEGLLAYFSEYVKWVHNLVFR